MQKHYVQNDMCDPAGWGPAASGLDGFRHLGRVLGSSNIHLNV